MKSSINQQDISYVMVFEFLLIPDFGVFSEVRSVVSKNKLKKVYKSKQSF